MTDVTELAKYIFSSDDDKLSAVENYLKTEKDKSKLWNLIDVEALVENCLKKGTYEPPWFDVENLSEIEDLSKFEHYPLLKKFISKRIKYYRDVVIGECCRPSFASFFVFTERLAIHGFSNLAFSTIYPVAKNDPTFKYFNLSQLSDEELLKSFVYSGSDFAIYLSCREEGLKPIGFICVDAYKDFWSFGYYIMPEYRRKGFAKEACKCIIENIKNKKIKSVKWTKYEDVYRRVSIGNKPIINRPLKENVASCKLLESLGFVKIGYESVEWTKYEDIYRRISIENKPIINRPLKENVASCKLPESLGLVKIGDEDKFVLYKYNEN